MHRIRCVHLRWTLCHVSYRCYTTPSLRQRKECLVHCRIQWSKPFACIFVSKPYVVCLYPMLSRCAMALLHSRIRRVFYCHRNPFCGALGSQYKLHVQKGLNHHFEVYECSRTLTTCSWLDFFTKMPTYSICLQNCTNLDTRWRDNTNVCICMVTIIIVMNVPHYWRKQR